MLGCNCSYRYANDCNGDDDDDDDVQWFNVHLEAE